MLSTHTHTNKERKSRGDLYVVTLQIVLEEKEEKEEKEKEKEKETKTCGVFLDSACGCCKNIGVFIFLVCVEVGTALLLNAYSITLV